MTSTWPPISNICSEGLPTDVKYIRILKCTAGPGQRLGIMSEEHDQATERTRLLLQVANDRRLTALHLDAEAASIVSSHVSKDEQALGKTPIGERLPYNDYTTIDWLHDLVCLWQFKRIAWCLYHIGQGLSSLTSYPIDPRPTRSHYCFLRRHPGLDSRYPYWHLHSLRRLSR